MAQVDEDLEDATGIFSLGSVRPSVQVVDRVHLLVYTQGTEVGKSVRLTPNMTFSIGRRSECDLVLKYEGVSRNHAKVHWTGSGYSIEDLGSSNGTMVQGRLITRQDLKDGDIIQFGPRVYFRYSIADAQEAGMLNQLYEASVRDALTGAYNREYLAERLNDEIAFAIRHKTDTSLILFDLDHFKRVNDTYGHQAGDQVLIEICGAVSGKLRAEDVLARYGGEEFAVSLRGIDPHGTALLAERLREGNERQVRFNNQQIPVTSSFGCAFVGDCEGEPTPEKMIAIADRRLYLAKQTGRNRVVCKG